MDDIGKGEKYLGNWSDNKKHGCGLIVTLDGIYYEGLFMQDVLTVSTYLSFFYSWILMEYLYPETAVDVLDLTE